MGPNLLSYIGVLAGQYHLSVRKIRSLLKEQLGTTFSVGTINEAQTKVASMLTPLHHAIRDSIQTAPLVHVDETSHPRNGEESFGGAGSLPVKTLSTRRSCSLAPHTQLKPC
ncbi:MULTISPECIES: IS66 family transposase [Vibrio]|uniref:IS66 family transposase n=1 Tax=Vibrio TaxID=662 RepID=UPI0021F80F8D|nr:transposase [Vibrio navarrensis]